MPSKGSAHFRMPVWILGILGFTFVGIQFIRRKLPNPLVGSEIEVPQDVKRVLQKSCCNCHSYETELSWFDE